MKTDEFVVISDTHFNHKNIIKYCDRPFESVEEMNTVMWDKMVEADTAGMKIIHLGDFMFGDTDVWSKHRKLKHPENHVFICGNHDKPYHIENVISKNFGTIVGTPGTWRTNVYELDIIDAVYHNDLRIAFSHDALPFNVVDEKYDLNIYGHHHNNVYRDPQRFEQDYSYLFDVKSREAYICGCVELWEYGPATFEQLIEQKPPSLKRN